MLLSSSQPLTSSFSNGIKKPTWLIVQEIVQGRNLFSVLIAPLHSSFCSFTVHWERPDVLWCICWHNDLFHHTEKKKREEFLGLQIFSLAAFNKQLLTAFPRIEDAAFSQWSQWVSELVSKEPQLMDYFHSLEQKLLLDQPVPRSCMTKGTDPSALLQRAVTYNVNFSIWGFQDYST